MKLTFASERRIDTHTLRGIPHVKPLASGGVPFLGANFARLRLRDTDYEVVLLDKLTYSDREKSLCALRTTCAPHDRDALRWVSRVTSGRLIGLRQAQNARVRRLDGGPMRPHCQFAVIFIS